MTDENLPKISVITPSFNQGRYIRQAIESVLQQEYPNFEHIVIDGGSTDETVETIRSFPHLRWVSERDRGQADALNKGIAQASGEIIAWLNADDWYPPGVFREVAAALADYPVVLGACELRDDAGTVLETVPNIERGWFEMFKYWIPYSIPAQPAVFFRSAVLEQIRRPDGSWLDRDLHYCMDYDLWMRIAARFPFRKRIDKVLAYYRMSGTNKTGEAQGGMSAAEPEMSRVFRRYEALLVNARYPVTVAVPADEDPASMAPVFEWLRREELQDFELIAVAPAASEQKRLRASCGEFNSGQRDAGSGGYAFVTERSASSSLVDAAVAASAGRVIVFPEHGAPLGELSLLRILRYFSTDQIGAVTMPGFTAVRRATLPEMGQLNDDAITQAALKRAAQCGWRVVN